MRAWVRDMQQCQQQLQPKALKQWCSCKSSRHLPQPASTSLSSWTKTALATSSRNHIYPPVKKLTQNKACSDRLHWLEGSFWLSIHMLKIGSTTGHCQTHTVLIIWDLQCSKVAAARTTTKMRGNFWDPQRLITRLYSRTLPLKSLLCQLTRSFKRQNHDSFHKIDHALRIGNLIEASLDLHQKMIYFSGLTKWICLTDYRSKCQPINF